MLTESEIKQLLEQDLAVLSDAELFNAFEALAGYEAELRPGHPLGVAVSAAAGSAYALIHECIHRKTSARQKARWAAQRRQRRAQRKEHKQAYAQWRAAQIEEAKPWRSVGGLTAWTLKQKSYTRQIFGPYLNRTRTHESKT